jgi:large subunit ribosomal protein L18Ae
LRRYFLHQLHKLKKTTGEILSCREIREKNSNIVKNYGLTIRYNSRSGTHNMYREYRDTRLAGAVEQMYADMAGRHRARFHSIHIVDTKEVPCGSRAAKRYNPEVDGDIPPVTVTRPGIKEFARNSKFPLVHRIQRAATRALRSTFVAQRPTTFFS